jgi:hypothetical protein
VPSYPSSTYHAASQHLPYSAASCQAPYSTTRSAALPSRVAMGDDGLSYVNRPGQGVPLPASSGATATSP